MKIRVEYTDTFGGEANYSWVVRKEFEVPASASDLQIVRHAKKLLGLNGVRCTREDWGDMLVLYPHGSCTVVFITFE